MRKVYLIVVLLAQFLSPTFAQRSPIDSLWEVIAKTKDPEKKLLERFWIGKLYLGVKPDSSVAIGHEIMAVSEKINSTVGKTKAYELLGRGYARNAEYQKSVEAHEQHLKLQAMLKDTEAMAAIKLNLGQSYEKLDQPDKALNFYLEALAVFEKLKNFNNVGSIYNSLGSVMQGQKKGKESLEYYHKALSITKQYRKKGDLFYCYANIGLTHDMMAQYDSAIYYYRQAIAIANKIGNKTFAAAQYNNLGVVYLNQGKYELAEMQFQNALPILLETGNKYYIGEIYRSLAKAANAKKNYAKAIEYIHAALPNIEGTEMLSTRQGAYEDLVVAYKGLGDYKNAFANLELATLYKDSINTQTDEKTFAELNTRFQASEKEAQISKQQLELARQSSQKRTILIGAIAALLALGGGFQYFRNKQRIKQKEVELNAQLQHAEAEKLREMDTMKSTFFANISHEFRTPLTLIISPLEQMLNGSFKDDFQKYYRIMHRNGKRLLDLVNQLLDLSRLESGKLKLEVSEGDLTGFVRSVAYSFESLAVRNQVDYQVAVPANPILGYIDKDKLEKILNNLISNAFKFTPEHGRVKLRLTTHHGEAIFQVEDSGIGIPTQQMPHLFDRFTKTTASEVQPSSGIGLALTKELVELHGGTISVNSQEGEGTTFTLTLPIEKTSFQPEQIVAAASITPDQPSFALDATPTTAARPQPIQEVLSAIEKPVLLIAEDNSDVRSFIVDQFKGHYQILEVENGKQGLQKALETTPDLIISDIMMPEMDGTEFCKQLKINEKTSHIPVVMLTALAEQADKLKGLETGADDYLVKPFDARELQVRVANLIAGRQKLQEHYRKSLNAFAPREVKAESLDAAFLNRVREAVEANLDDETFSVVELGAQVGMSRSQLHRKLSALTGFSPNEVIRNMRLERARQLLQQKAGNASEVSYMTGFNSPAYFAKCFKDYFGVTPSEVA